jgi:hypothetical protein
MSFPLQQTNLHNIGFAIYSFFRLEENWEEMSQLNSQLYVTFFEKLSNSMADDGEAFIIFAVNEFHQYNDEFDLEGRRSKSTNINCSPHTRRGFLTTIMERHFSNIQITNYKANECEKDTKFSKEISRLKDNRSLTVSPENNIAYETNILSNIELLNSGLFNTHTLVRLSKQPIRLQRFESIVVLSNAYEERLRTTHTAKFNSGGYGDIRTAEAQHNMQRGFLLDMADLAGLQTLPKRLITEVNLPIGSYALLASFSESLLRKYGNADERASILSAVNTVERYRERFVQLIEAHNILPSQLQALAQRLQQTDINDWPTFQAHGQSE